MKRFLFLSLLLVAPAIAAVGPGEFVLVMNNAKTPDSSGGSSYSYITNIPSHPALSYYVGVDYTSGSWPDRSGNGYTLTQSGSSSLKPGTSTLDSQQVVTFDGGDYLTNTVYSAGTAHEIIALMKATVSSSYIFGSLDASHQHAAYNDGTTQWLYNYSGSFYIVHVKPNTTTYSANFCLFSTSGLLGTNYVENAVDGGGVSTTHSGFVLGCHSALSPSFQGTIVELATFDAPLTTAIRSNIVWSWKQQYPSAGLP